MKLAHIAHLAVIFATQVLAADEPTSIQDKMFAAGADKDIVFSLADTYGIYLLAEFCQRTGFTGEDDLEDLAEIAKRYEAAVDLPGLQAELWAALSREIKELAIQAFDTNQSYGMCLDVKRTVDRTVMERQAPAPKPF